MLKNALLFNQTKPDELAQYIFLEINLFSKKIEKMLSLENIWWGGYQNNIFQSCKMQQRMLLQTTYYILHIAVCSALCCIRAFRTPSDFPITKEKWSLGHMDEISEVGLLLSRLNLTINWSKVWPKFEFEFSLPLSWLVNSKFFRNYF